MVPSPLALMIGKDDLRYVSGKERSYNDETGDFTQSDCALTFDELTAFDFAVEASISKHGAQKQINGIMESVLSDTASHISLFAPPFETPSAIAMKTALSFSAAFYAGVAEKLCTCHIWRNLDCVFDSAFLIDCRSPAQDGRAMRLLLRVCPWERSRALMDEAPKWMGS